METVNKRSSGPELADVFRNCQQDYLSRHRLTADQHKAFRAIVTCRTSIQGSHRLICEDCDHIKTCYNSCRNRHCPKCQYVRQLLWVERLKSRLLPVRYFHVVFTVPQMLRPLFYLNQKKCYDLLFASSAEAVRKTGANPSFLGVQTGNLSVLHTWGQSLTYHPHIHMLIPAGGVDQDGMEWVYSHRKFFVPVKALSSVFRGLLFSGLEKHLNNGELTLPDRERELYEDRKALRKLLYEKNWHVYIKKTFQGAGQVVSYLGRYTHRVAISNSRIQEVDKTSVKFRYKDYRTNRIGLMELSTTEFIRRFLQHILPTGFYKIRYYGILSPATSSRIDCFALLKSRKKEPEYLGYSTYELLMGILGEEMFRCPCCRKGRMVYVVPSIHQNSS